MYEPVGLASVVSIDAAADVVPLLYYAGAFETQRKNCGLELSSSSRVHDTPQKHAHAQIQEHRS